MHQLNLKIRTFLFILLSNCEPDEQYKQDAYLNQKLITREISEASLDRAWIRQGISHRERAPIGWHLLQTLPSPTISLFLFIRLDPIED